MKLLDSVIKSAKPKTSTYSISDGGGLSIYIQPGGSKLWRFRYRFGGKANMISLGQYPVVSLAQARQEHARLRELLAQDIDPSRHRKDAKVQAAAAAKNTFKAIARLWCEHWKHNKTEQHIQSVIRRLESDIFPGVSDQPINDLKASQFIAMAHRIESRGASSSARRALIICNQIFRFAVAFGLAERNPVADVRPSDVLKPAVKTNYARLSERELPELLRKIDQYDGSIITKLALQLMALTFVRTSELIGGCWEEFDFDKREWRIPAYRMKMRSPHIVPLSTQAIAVLKEIKSLGVDEVLIFPSERGNGESMSKNTLLYAIYRLGFKGKMTGHGFRGIASTILHERGFNHDYVELQLAHSPRDAVSAAYNHALYLEPRAKMMQQWADFLDELKGSE